MISYFINVILLIIIIIIIIINLFCAKGRREWGPDVFSRVGVREASQMCSVPALAGWADGVIKTLSLPIECAEETPESSIQKEKP